MCCSPRGSSGGSHVTSKGFRAPLLGAGPILCVVVPAGVRTSKIGPAGVWRVLTRLYVFKRRSP